MSTYALADLERRMDGALDALKKDFSGLRTGRASVNLLEPVMVEAYGGVTPLTQVGAVTAPEPRLLSVQVWDKSVVKAVEKAIRNAGLGLNPVVDGQVIRVPVPDLTEERRAELAKVAAKYAEQARVAIRNIRRDGMDALKKAEKDGDISKDAHRAESDKVQKLTDDFVARVDDALKTKEKEIMHV